MKGRGTYGDKEKKKDKKKKAQEPTAVVAKKLPPVSHIYFRLLRGFFLGFYLVVIITLSGAWTFENKKSKYFLYNC